MSEFLSVNSQVVVNPLQDNRSLVSDDIRSDVSMPVSNALQGITDPLLYKTKPDMNRDIQFSTEDYKIDDHNRQEAPPIASFRQRLRPNSKMVPISSQKSFQRNRAAITSADILFNNEDNKRLSTEEQVHATQNSFYFNLKHLP